MSLARSTLPEARRPKLAALLAQARLLQAIECHDALSAILGEQAQVDSKHGAREFDLLWASGFSHATTMGLPDAGMAILERRLQAIADIAAMTSKPIIADADTGGDALAFGYLCSRLEQIGVSAVVVEDKAGAKRTSLAHGVTHELENPAAFVAKIDSVRARLSSAEFLIFARLESLIAGVGIEDAIARARLYLRSTANGLVIHSKDRTGKEVVAFMDAYRRLQRESGTYKPLVCIPTAYNHMTGAELFEHGASIVIHGNHMIRAAFSGMQKAACAILAHDRSLEADELCAPVATVFDTVGVGT